MKGIRSTHRHFPRTCYASGTDLEAKTGTPTPSPKGAYSGRGDSEQNTDTNNKIQGGMLDAVEKMKRRETCGDWTGRFQMGTGGSVTDRYQGLEEVREGPMWTPEGKNIPGGATAPQAEGTVSRPVWSWTSGHRAAVQALTCTRSNVRLEGHSVTGVHAIERPLHSAQA